MHEPPGPVPESPSARCRSPRPAHKRAPCQPSVLAKDRPASRSTGRAARSRSRLPSRWSLVSPRQTIGISLAAKAAWSLRLTCASVSPSPWRRSLWPRITCVQPASTSIAAGQLAGVGPGGLPVHVLGTQSDRRALEDRVDLSEKDGRRAEDDAHSRRLADSRLDRLGQGHGFGASRRVHLPVARDQQGAHVSESPVHTSIDLPSKLGELADSRP